MLYQVFQFITKKIGWLIFQIFMISTFIKNRAFSISKKFLYKTINIYNGKTVIKKTITKAYLFTKVGIYVPTKATGKSIHDSERNRKRKAKKKNK